MISLNYNNISGHNMVDKQRYFFLHSVQSSLFRSLCIIILQLYNVLAIMTKTTKIQNFGQVREGPSKGSDFAYDPNLHPTPMLLQASVICLGLHVS
jgi:hypothetical protein